MSHIKTKVNDLSPNAFIGGLENEKQKKDALELLKLFKRATGENPKMWGSSIIGYGEYHYKSERSTQEGDWPLTGFSPRKQNLSIYIMPGFKNYQKLLSSLGKYKTSVSCLYINKLEDIDLGILEKIISLSLHDMKKIHGLI